MLRTLRMVYRPRPDATPSGGLDAPRSATFGQSLSRVVVVGGAGVGWAQKPSPLVRDEHAGRKTAGPRTWEVGVGGGRVIVDA